MAHEELEDVLDTLCHDLGKYLLMPISMLPRDAGPDALRAALCRALHETRRGPGGVETAREIYEAGHAQLRALGATDAQLAPLRAAMQRALACEAWLSDPAREPSREVLLTELGAVRDALTALYLEARHE
jgi:hypothetical protein